MESRNLVLDSRCVNLFKEFKTARPNAQQCEEWPGTLGNSWARRVWRPLVRTVIRCGSDANRHEGIMHLSFFVVSVPDFAQTAPLTWLSFCTVLVWMTRMNAWLKDPSTGIDFQLCCLIEKWVSITSDTKQHTPTHSAQLHELVSLIAQSDNYSLRGQSGGIIQKGEPHERNPCAPGLEEWTLEETSRQADCDSKVAWNLARNTMLSKWE